MQSKKWIVLAAVFGLTGVAAGALGAHALQDRLDPKELASYDVAVRYQMYHALALLAVAWLSSETSSRLTNASGWCFASGVVCFSGSIYGLIFLSWRWLGPITPLGGLLFMTGWLLLGIVGMTGRKNTRTDGA
jgi:uncharacterized membrane protein YgdD (TMEM256/DUF423 family)